MANNRIVLDAVNSDPQAIHEQAGTTGRLLISALDRAVAVQTSAVEKYVDHLRSKNPNATPGQLQRMLDNHFMYLATGAGASAGATAAIPGLGLVMSMAAVSAESVVFVDAAAFYTIASAHVRGVDIRDKERRRALILVTLIGSAGTALVDAAVGDLGKQLANQEKNTTAATMLSRFGTPRLKEVNGRLLSMATKRMGKSVRNAWLGKLMPLGIGAVIGSVANRKLAKRVIANAQESLGPLPE